MELKDRSLLREEAYIDGAWIGADGNAPLYRFRTEDEVIRMVNDTEFDAGVISAEVVPFGEGIRHRSRGIEVGH